MKYLKLFESFYSPVRTTFKSGIGNDYTNDTGANSYPYNSFKIDDEKKAFNLGEKAFSENDDINPYIDQQYPNSVLIKAWQEGYNNGAKNKSIKESLGGFKYRTTTKDENVYIKVYDNSVKIGSISFHTEMGNEEDWYYFDDYIVLISDVSVDKDYQKIGIGAKLMEKCLNYIKKHYTYINKVVLNACPTGFNKIPLTKLVEFYKTFGFEIFQSETNNVIMVKTLNLN